MRQLRLDITADGDLRASYAGESVTFALAEVARLLHPSSPLTLTECLAMRSERSKGVSSKALARKYGVDVRTAYRITHPRRFL